MDQRNRIPQSKVKNNLQTSDLSNKLNQEALLKLAMKMKLVEEQHKARNNGVKP